MVAALPPRGPFGFVERHFRDYWEEGWDEYFISN